MSLTTTPSFQIWRRFIAASPITCPSSLSLVSVSKSPLLKSHRIAASLRCYSSSTRMGDAIADANMDAVQRRLMFEDECILVDENDRVVGHDTKYNCKFVLPLSKCPHLHIFY
uniref:Isopentenyl-diphosphate Delta-isomerase I-like n=1 Tax=Nicotiana sylvestris TaxID=4096 RepID=A0A1U7YAU1_NICSY|nr:PREDICTED: isopentenyl-diphosphate Delta-isomerase I-like [Nicotiana sylvestris]